MESLRFHLFSFLFLCLLTSNVNAQQIQHKKLRDDVMQEKEDVNAQKLKIKEELPAPETDKKSTKKKKTAKAAPIQPLEPVAPIKTPYDQKTAKIIYLENADLVTFDQITRPDVQILNGNVKFRHDDAIMTCDSAYFYKNSNSLDAFSNVKIVQGDTLFVYGNKLYYNGDTRLARLRGKARLINRNTVLTTDSLNYDRNTELAYYFTGGKIVDAENTLTSVWGQYSTSTEDALFKQKVKLVNKNFTMDADTLKYNTHTHIADLVGETHIVYHDETNIYTDNGWYNTQTERSMLLDRSYLIDKDGKSLTGDTVFYDKVAKYGEIFGKAILNDTVNKSTLYGNYVYYSEDRELGIATDSALLVDWSDALKHMYIHADTLKTFKDSIYNEAIAWRGVRFYREDVQGLADSLVYSSRDSIIHLTNEPVVWQENQQFSAEEIRILTENQTVKEVHLERSALSVEQADWRYFNQLSGKEIIAYVDSSELRRVHVNGNAETIYFIQEEKERKWIGANRTESSYVNIYIKDKKADRIVLTPSSSGEFHPIHMIENEFVYLPHFFWMDAHRPKQPEDVFLRFTDDGRQKFSLDDGLDEEDEGTTKDEEQSEVELPNINELKPKVDEALGIEPEAVEEDVKSLETL